MSAGESFAEQVRRQRDELRDRLAALDYVAEIDAQAEKAPAYAKDRARGGTLLDPVDPTRITMPIVWLRALLNHARGQGYAALADSPALVALVERWNANYHRDDAAIDRLRAVDDEFADLLVVFFESL